MNKILMSVFVALTFILSGSLYAADCNPNSGSFVLADIETNILSLTRATTNLAECGVDRKKWTPKVELWFENAEKRCAALKQKLTKQPIKDPSANWATCDEALAEFQRALIAAIQAAPSAPAPAAKAATPTAPAAVDSVDKLLDMAQQKLKNNDPKLMTARRQLKLQLDSAKAACAVKTAATCRPSLEKLVPLIKQIP